MRPLTLVNQVLLLIICNLEWFSVKALKVLPSKLRHQLLLNLPALDICRLEEHDFDEDSNSVWDELSAIRIPHTGGYEIERNMMYDSSFDDWKAYYFGIVTHALLGRIKPTNYRTHYELVLHLLLGVPDCLNITDWSKFRFSYFAPIVNRRPLIPNRHLKHLATRRSDISFINFIMENCHYKPKFIYVVCDMFAESEVYKSSARDLLTNYFSDVEKVAFAFDFDERLGAFNSFQKDLQKTLPYDATSLVLKTILANDPPALKCLEFRDFNAIMLDESLKMIGPLFYGAVTTKGSKYLPYRGLKDIRIAIRDSQSPSNEAMQKLLAIVKNQGMLEQLRLHRLVSERAYLTDKYTKFLVSLSTFVRRSYFQSLILKGMSVPIESAQNIITGFLSSPSLHNQIVRFDNVTVVGQPSDDDTPRKIAMHENSSKFKKLELFYSEIPAYFFKWLFGHSQVWLYKLEITNCRLQEPTDGPYYSKTENIFHFLASVSDLKIQHLDFSSVTPCYCRTSAQDFKVLLSNPHLKSFSIRSCSIGYHGLLPCLTAGLATQIQVGILESLVLMNNELGDVPVCDLQEFFDVLFYLPQLETLEVNLSHNMFTIEHIEIMHSAWKFRSGEKRLKSLMFGGSGFPKDKSLSVKLSDMAVKCHHW